jgi:hypothetical protein
LKIFSANRVRTVAEDVSGGSGSLGRRSVLGGLASLPVLYTVTMPASAQAAARPSPPAHAGPRAQTESVPPATDHLASGLERRYNAPLLTPGTRLVLPEGVKATSVLNYYRQPHIASTESEWPYLTAADGSRVDASVIPERGAPTRVAVLTGFTDGWYDVIHTNGRADHVSWDARKFPVLWMYGEFGATNEPPYHNWIYALALQPFSRNPYSHSTSTR